MENKVIAKEYVDKNYISNNEIRKIFKEIQECKIGKKVNATNYMIWGKTDRAIGWFINLDYIEKVLLKEPGYRVGDKNLEDK